MSKKSERKEALFRILILLLTGILLIIWRVLVLIIAIIHWIIVIITGERKRDLAEFCEYWNTELYRFVHYITFMSNKRPFPFSPLKKKGKFDNAIE